MASRRFLSSLGVSVACLLACPANAQTSTPQPAIAVAAQPALTVAGNWSVEPASTSILNLDQVGDRLAIDFRDFSKDGVARVLLANPVAVPEGTNGFTCVIHSDGGHSLGIASRLIIEDAHGVEFLYELRSRALRSPFRGYYPNNHRAKPIRLYTPGLNQPVIAPKAGMNIWLADPAKRATPVGPLKIKGLQFTSLGFFKYPSGKPEVTVFWGDFAFTQLEWRESSLYYSLAENEHYGEIDPPSITLGHLGTPYHGTYTVSWELRDRFDGPPVAVGGESFRFDTADPLIPLRKLEFPVREKGTYWITVKRRWAADSRVAAGRVDQNEFRLDIVRGVAAVTRPPLPATEPVLHSAIRIAPGRPSSIFSINEPFIVPVSFWPDVPGSSLSYRIEARPTNDALPVKTIEGKLTDAATISFDLNSLPPGGYMVKAEFLSGDKVVDRTERMIGRLSSEATPAAIPASVPSWQHQLSREASFIRVQPHGHDSLKDPAIRWDHLRGFLDNVGEISRDVEYGFRWQNIELMPGVYDWSETDRFLDYAKEKGFSVMLWPSVVGAEPAWIPAWFEEPRDAAGNIFNSMPYTFHGGRINHLYSDEARVAAFRFLRAMVARYRSHPAVTAYYFLTEHPHDMPPLGWFVGGSPETQAAFRTEMRTRFVDLPRLNARWSTSYRDWSQVGIPPADASRRQQLDWLAFLRDGNSRYVLESVKELRKLDTHRLVQTYMGASTKDLLELKGLGCMVADGGSQNPETFGAASMGVAELGLQRRPEEVSVGNWSQHFPTQLDATLFTMLLGGGGNSNCKMFIPVTRPFESLRPAPHSLDRFKQFIPIWNELRHAKSFPREVFSFFETDAQLLENGSTLARPDTWDHMVAMESGLTAPAMDAVFATKGKLVLVGGESIIEKPALDELVRYVNAGGTVVMRADSGRECPDLPAQDWALLRAFGFTPPAGDVVRGTRETIPIKGDVFPETASSFQLREYWPATPGADERVIATLASDARPAVTWKPLGSGRVVVVWASTIIPGRGNATYPFLRDIARWAGVTLRTDSDSTAIWANFLRTDSGDIFYGLVYHSAWQMESKPAVSSRVRWTLPEQGDYRVTELISGSDLGSHTADALMRDGLPVTLAPRGVAIYRIEKTTAR